MKARYLAIGTVTAVALFGGCTTVKEEVKEVKVDVTPVSQAEASPKENFARGVAAFDAGKLDEAKKLFKKVEEKAPNTLGVVYNLGLINEREGSLVDAARYYEQARKLDPTHKPTLLNLGRVYRLQDKFAEAIALYEEALKKPENEFDVALNNNLTVAYRLNKQFEKAEATAQRVLARTKDNPDAYKNLALIYFDQGKYRLAEFISANAKKLDDKDPGVYNNLGLIYLKLEDKRLALAQFEKAVSLNKDFAPSLFNIGAMALSYRDYPTAEKVLSRVTELDPSSYEGFLAYGWALDGQKARDVKKGPKAGEVFERVLAIKATQSDAICGAAWAYATEKGTWDKALAFFDKCKALPSTSGTDQQLIDSKVKGILAMQKSEQPKEKPKAPTGPSLIDKVSDEAPAASTEGVAPAVPAPAPAKP
jgi:tetratricopeptide (TPR) repeat protein